MTTFNSAAASDLRDPNPKSTPPSTSPTAAWNPPASSQANYTDPAAPRSTQGDGPRNTLPPINPSVAASNAVANKPPAPVIMPMPAPVAEERIATVSPEGRPGDPKAGPRFLRWESWAILFVVLTVAVIAGFAFNWIAGVVAFIFWSAAIFLNPVFGAARERAAERERVVEGKTTPQPPPPEKDIGHGDI